MFSYYDTEFQPELRQADVERGLARARAETQATLARPRPVHERVAAALIALAAQLTRAVEGEPLPSQAARPTAWR